MKRIIVAILVLALMIPQGFSIALAEGSGNNILWDCTGEDIIVHNNDTITIKGTAGGVLTVPNNTTVTIVGSVVNMPMNVGLNIGSGAKVRWGAEYRGAGNRIDVTGKGTLEIVSGALIENTTGLDDTIASMDKTITIVVNGGTVRTKGKNGSSIFTVNSDVIINGGTVEDLGDR